MIRTLLADDSISFRAALTAVLSASGHFEVVGTAGSGEEAVARADRLRPDLVIMDVVMPGLDGFDATSRIMQSAPCAVVVMSSVVDAQQQTAVFRALEAGAVEAIGKPKDLTRAQERSRLVETLRAMAAVKVVRRRRAAAPPAMAMERPVRAVAMGASTGGPPALAQVLRAVGTDFAAPVLVAQHLASGFAPGLARWIHEASGLRALLVEDRQRLQPGAVYLPAEGCHLLWEDDWAVARPAPPAAGAVPSVNALFESLGPISAQVVAVLLTGMGSDGAQGLSRLRTLGAHTIAQDEASSLVFGMPRVARELGAVMEELSLDAVGPRLRQLVNRGAV